MAKDIINLAEAYKHIYEAGEAETGAIASKAAPAAPAQTTTSAPPVPAPSVQLNSTDSTKILKNISDIYTKTKEIAGILEKNNIPNATKSLQQESYKLAALASQIVALTPEASDDTVKNKLYSNLNKDISSQISIMSSSQNKQNTPNI